MKRDFYSIFKSRWLFEAFSNNLVVAGCFLFIVNVGILYVRMPDVFINPQFRDEDGSLLFLQNYLGGWHAFLHPYNGYFLLAQRILAFICSPITIVNIPFAYLMLSIVLLTITQIFILRVDERPLVKWMMVLATTLVPQSGEVFGTVADVQWFLPLGAIAILFTNHASMTNITRWSELAFVLVVSFTGPFVIFLAPIFIARAFFPALSRAQSARIRSFFSILNDGNDRHYLVMAGMMLLGMVTQAIAVVKFNALYAFSTQGPPNPLTFWNILGFRLFSSILTSQTVANDYRSAFPFIIAFGLTILFLKSLRVPSRFWKNSIILIVIVGVLIPVYLRFGSNIGILSITANGDRYFYIEKVLISWFLFANLPHIRVTALMFFIVVLTSAQSFTRAPLKDLDWPKYARSLMDGNSVDFPINGGGEVWLVHVDPRRSR